VKPTRASVLALVFALCGIGAGFGLAAAYASLPALPTSWVVTVGVIALVVALLAWTTRNRLGARDGAKPPEPLTMARYAALARACSPVGAGVSGAWLGALAYLLTLDGGIAVVSHDRRESVAGLATGAALTAAGLWLEWVCRVKVDHDDGPRGRI
jgi:hypothetical protein